MVVVLKIRVNEGRRRKNLSGGNNRMSSFVGKESETITIASLGAYDLRI